MNVGILHPGAMGSALGACLRESGQRVLWASRGRSDGSRRRAAHDGLEDVDTVEALADTCELLVSLCPSSAASSVARKVAECGYRGTYVDANAVSRQTFESIEEIVGSVGAQVIDGCVIGPPPRRPHTTRMYLAGTGAGEVAALFTETRLEAAVLEGRAGQASSLKICYAAETKGGAALTLFVRVLAAREGVEAALLEEWERSRPGVQRRSERAAESALLKGARWADEMREISDAFSDQELPRGVHEAAALLFDAVADADPSVHDFVVRLAEDVEDAVPVSGTDSLT